MDDSDAITRVDGARERPDARGASAGTPADALPGQIGRFYVIGRLGRGAMGVVYAAFDPQLERKVALKLVSTGRSGSDSSGSAHARLLREAQALAKLSHPNIVTIHEVGEWRGDVFLAMEFVQGSTLRAWMKEHLERDPQRRRWREAVAVFLQAGEGLAAAHAAGLVHRDFKPDNVLVGNDGRVRVVDFGLARDRGQRAGPSDGEHDLELTQTGTILGTPAYMAPEQHRGDVCDARSDQYSFCIALHEALYGARPFKGPGLDALAESKGRGVQAPPPRAVRVPRRLFTALVRGLQPDPDRRYPDMRALLDELQRDPTRSLRRGLVGAALVACVVGVSLSYRCAADRAETELYAARARACEAGTEQLADVWGDARREALARRFDSEELRSSGRAVLATLDRYTEQWKRARIEVCQATRLRGQQSPQLMTRRNACLDRALATLHARVDAMLAVEDASLTSIGEALHLPALTVCTDGRQNSAIDPPEDPERVARLLDVVERIETLLEMHSHGDLRQELADLERDAAALGYRPLLARVALLRGVYDEDMGRFTTARERYLEALRLAELSRDDRTSIDALVHLISVASSNLGAQAEAETLLPRMITAFDRFGEDDPGLSARVLRVQAKVALASGDHERAIALFERCAREHLRADQDVPGYSALGNVGVVLNRMNRPRAAIPYFERVLSQFEARGLVPLNLLGVQHINFGRSFLLLGEYDRAIEHFERAEEFYRRSVRNEPELVANQPGLSLARYNRAIALFGRGAHREAIPLLEEALESRRRSYGDRSSNVTDTALLLARAHAELGEVDAAERLLAQVDDARAPDADSTALAHVRGLIAARRGRLGDARTHLERVLFAHDASPDKVTCSERIEVELALGDVLWQTPRTRAQAVAAVTARLSWASASAAAGACGWRPLDRLELWLAEHPRDTSVSHRSRK